MLSKLDAEDIYKTKISIMATMVGKVVPTNIRGLIRGKCNPVAAKYGVSSRTIRDIWNRKTWQYATQPLWQEEKNICTVCNVEYEVTGVLQVHFIDSALQQL